MSETARVIGSRQLRQRAENAGHPWTVLAQIGATTSTIGLGTAIYLLALRHPIVTARHAVTLEALAGGRLILGVGVGGLTMEFPHAGHRRTRLSRTEEEAVAVSR